MSTEEKKPLIVAMPALAVVQTLFPDHAAAYLAECLTEAALVVEIKNPADQTLAAGTLSKLTGFLKQLDESRKIVKQPFWDAGVAIDAFAKEKGESAETEKERIKRLLAAFHAEEMARVAREREEQRKAEEAARIAEEARQAAAAQAEIDDRLFDPNYVPPQAEPAPVPAPAPVYVAPVSKVKGTTVKTKWTYEVTNIHELYKAHPHLVKLEVNHTLLMGYINAGGQVDPTNIPGITCTKTTDVSTRAAKAVARNLEG